jgi:dihydroflavonol-4-reductase/farnesol dehydrogenase
MKVSVTGATGFIGRKLCLELAQSGTIVHALCRNENHPLLIKHSNIIVFKGDITDSQSLLLAMEGCEQVYHTAAMAKMWCRDKNEFHKVNVEGTKNVLEAAQTLGVKKVVHTSSCGVIGPTHKYPLTEADPRIIGFPIAYERTKFLAELVVKEYVQKGMNIVIVNPSRVYGEGPITDSNTVGKMVRGYLKGKWRIVPGDGKQVANYVYVDDVVKGHIAAMEKGVTGERYILGGEDISFEQFFNEVTAISQKKYRLYQIPLLWIKLYSRMDKLKTLLTGLPPVLLPEFADRLTYDQRYRSRKAEAHLGYTITPFKQGLANTIHYFQTQTT